jgi:tetratricopeptide (TPR) repeat protein
LNLLHTKNFKKAAQIFNTYIQTESCDNFLILFLLGSHFNRTNDFVIAKEFLIQAAKLFDCHVVFQELGKCFMGLNLMDLAENAFLNALQYEINDIDSLVNLGIIYKILGRYDALNFCDYSINNNK